MDLRVARRYAKALYRVAVENSMVAAVEDDLNGVNALLENDEKFRDLLLAPTYGRDLKEKVLEKAFADRITGVTMQLLRILLVKRREEDFPTIREEFIRIRRFEGQVLYAEISSSEPLSPEHKTSLLEKLAKITGKAVEPNFVVNPNLIGGVKVSYDNYVLDGSIRGGLNRLRDALRYDLLKQN